MKPFSWFRPRLGTTVLVVGPCDARGGIATVMRLYRGTDLWSRMGCRELSTYAEGSRLSKAWAALCAYGRAPALILQARLVHVHLSGSISCTRKLPIIAMARLLKRPVIVHVHAASMHSITGHPLSCFARLAFRLATHVVALSNVWAKNLTPLVKRAAVHVVPNPVSPLSAAEISCDAAGVPVVLYCGRLEPRKGYDVLLQATRALVQQLPGVQVWLAGDGALQDAEHRARSLGIEDSIRLLGWVDATRMGPLLRRATVFCLPSFGEGVPMAVLEAMNYSLPVVTTPVGGLPELIRDGENGMFVEPGNVESLQEKLALLLRDAELRQRMGSRAKQSVDTACGFEMVMHKMEFVYKEALCEERYTQRASKLRHSNNTVTKGAGREIRS